MKNRTEDGIPTQSVIEEREAGTGPDSAGQSGDAQGLPDIPELDPETDEAELVLEMEEESPDGEVKEVRVRQRSQDDVPLEYLNQD